MGEIMKKSDRSESGQIMILLVLAIVGIFAFAALAIDGAMVYSDRRIAKNAADASALAGAGNAGQALKNTFVEFWNCGEIIDEGSPRWTNAITASVNLASENDFTIQGVYLTNYPDSDSAVAIDCYDDTEHYLDVFVKITSQTPTSFAHFFFDGPLVNTVESKVRLHPRLPYGGGASIVSLTPDCHGNDYGTKIGGTQNVILEGGGIFSNSCLTLDGSSGLIKVITDTETGEMGSIQYLTEGGYENNGGMTVIPEPVQATDPVSMSFDVDCPDPATTVYTDAPQTDEDDGEADGVITLTQGNYTKLQYTAPVSVTMGAGLYCIDGVFQFSGESINGVGVTIAMVDNKGFSTSGGSTVHLESPKSDCGDPCPEGGVSGLLLWMAPGNDKPVDLSGNSCSEFLGTVYAPESEIHLGGTSSLEECEGHDLTYAAMLVGYNIKIQGSVDVNIKYDREFIPYEFLKLEVSQ